MPTADSSRALATAARVVFVAGLTAAAVSAFVASSGGVRIDLGVLRVSARSPWPALVTSATCLLAAAALRRRGAPGDLRGLDRALGRRASWLAATVALAVLLTGLEFGSTVAAGADSSGYVSQAALWRTGSLVVLEPLITQASWPDAALTFSPLGYRPGLEPATIVPSYPPGLPLQFALAWSAAGERAVALVVPMLGALAVWLAYVLGRRLDGPVAGVGAVVLLAASPSFLNQLLQPMSDVPATAWWLAVIALLVLTRPSQAVLAGMAAGIAVLTRPNLVPVLAAIAPLVAWPVAPDDTSGPCGRRGPEAGRRSLLFLAGATPPLLLLAWVNTRLYGSPWSSGYGDAGHLFSWANVLPNLRLYATWLAQTHLPLVILVSVGCVMSCFSSSSVGQRRLTLTLALLTVATLGCYLAYSSFETWTYLRFLLPGIAAACILAGMAWARLTRALPTWARLAATAVGLGLVAGSGVGLAREGGAFEIARREQRYRAAAEWIRDHSPPETIVLAAQHSGSIRHTAARTIVRWDVLDPSTSPPATLPAPPLDTILRGQWPAGSARPALLVVDADEEAAFRTRFGAASEFGALDWPAWASTDPPSAVRIYRLQDRVAHRATGEARTVRITRSR